MKKINKEYLWLAYLLIVSTLGILLLTNHLPVPSVAVQSVEKVQEEKTETEFLQEAEIRQEEEVEESLAEIEMQD